MKVFWKEIIVCLLMGLVVPGALMDLSGGILKKAGRLPGYPDPTVPVLATVEETEVPETQAPTEPEPGPQILVRDAAGAVSSADLEDYLVGVVLAEMPASFEPETLKAQAVAARTYAAKAMKTGGKHGDGSICTDSTCCQAWLSEESYVNQGGLPQAVEKVRRAVNDTAGEVIVYQGELIEATYFSCSGGSTEDARAVWGSDFPYLKAVESPGEEAAEGYQEERSFNKEKLEMLLDITLPDDPHKWLGPITRTPGQGVATIELGGKTFRGTELRQKLGLRSTSFQAQAGDFGLTLTTRGHGHRVGMSQYGADAMAVTGSTYPEILGHYYPGTLICQYGDLEALNQGISGND